MNNQPGRELEEGRRLITVDFLQRIIRPSCLLVDIIPYLPTKFTLDEILRKFNSDVFILSPLFYLLLHWVVVLILLSSYTDTSFSKGCLTNMNPVMSLIFSLRLVKFSIDGAGYSLRTKALPLPDVRDTPKSSSILLMESSSVPSPDMFKKLTNHEVEATWNHY